MRHSCHETPFPLSDTGKQLPRAGIRSLFTKIPLPDMNEEPQFSTDKADVVIYDRRSGIVTTVADWNLSAASAVYQLDKIREKLAPRFAVKLVPVSSANVGSVVAEPDLPMPEPRKLSLREYRKADCKCVRCGSAELASADYCQGCLEKANERSARSQRKLRDVQEIG